MPHANCLELPPILPDRSTFLHGHVITAELATPISELQPINCCHHLIFWQTLVFIHTGKLAFNDGVKRPVSTPFVHSSRSV